MKIKDIKYPSIKRMDNIEDKDMIDFNENFIIEEKYDGSNTTIIFNNDGETSYFSRRQKLKVVNGKIEGSFKNLIDYVDKAIEKYGIKITEETITMHGEYIEMGQLKYNKTHKQFIPFEIKYGDKPYELFKENEIKTISKTSNNVRQREVDSGEILSKIDGKTPIEGIVMKQFKDGKLLRMKVVSKNFKETIKKSKKDNSYKYFAKARIDKFLNQLVEDNLIDKNEINDLTKIGNILKYSNNLVLDLWKEEEKKLIKIFKNQLKGYAVNDIKKTIRERIEVENEKR